MSNEWPKNNTESEKSIDFLNEKLNVAIEIEDEVFEYFPVITQEEYESKTERYRALLGKIKFVEKDHVKIIIAGVLEAEKDENFYEEDINGINHVDISAMKKFVSQARNTYPEYREYDLVGELHTHPYTPQEVAPNDSISPSNEDFYALVDNYEKKITKF